MKSLKTFSVAKNVFGVLVLLVPTIIPSSTLNSAVPFNTFQPSRFLPLKRSCQSSVFWQAVKEINSSITKVYT